MDTVHSPPQTPTPSEAHLTTALQTSALVENIGDIKTVAPNIHLRSLPRKAIRRHVHVTKRLNFSYVRLPDGILCTSVKVSQDNLAHRLTSRLHTILSRTNISITILNYCGGLTAPSQRRLVSGFTRCRTYLGFTRVLNKYPINARANHPGTRGHITSSHVASRTLSTFVSKLTHIYRYTRTINKRVLVRPN